jgi:5'-nucleotidase
VDVLVAVTHQALADDQRLIEEVPGIDLVVGGHEHENLYQRRGPALVPLVKADANARTAWVLRLAYDTTHRRLSIAPELVPLDAGIGSDPVVEGEVNRWLARGFQGFRAQGFDPDRVVARTTVELDGREASVRTRPTTLTALIAQAIRAEDKAADLALYNSGGIRLDDVLPAGDLTQYDIIRVLPFGNRVVSLLVRGDILRRVLAEGERLRGSGGFLQWSGVSREGDVWLVNGRPLEAGRTYRVATIDFLAAGREQGLEFFKPGEPGVSAVEGNPGRDLRFAFIDLLASCKEMPVRCLMKH